jgi:hypothetical protein
MAIVSSMLENLKFVQNITLFLVHTDHLFPNKVMKNDVSQAGTYLHAAWTISSSLENGSAWDRTINSTTGINNSGFNRTAVSAGFKPSEKTDFHIKGEIRLESSEDHVRDSTSFYLETRFGLCFIDDRRMLGNIGANYNFGRFFDDLRDIVAYDQGIFVDVIEKF